MRTVAFDPSQLTGADQDWWEKWQKRADRATRGVIQAWEAWLAQWLAASAQDKAKMKFEYKFNSDIWSDLKGWFLDHTFYNKCAYCETSILRFYGDAEHHRPKGRVRVKDQNGTLVPVRCEIGVGPPGLQMQHPGYFWLAYNWKNLVPSCEFCNTGQGKQDQYPTSTPYVLMRRLNLQQVLNLEDTPIESQQWPGWFYLGPHDLDDLENPLLVNPLNPDTSRDPMRHLRFGVRGIVVAVQGSDIGEKIIGVLRLDDPNLERGRQGAQEKIHRTYFGKYAADLNATDLEMASWVDDFNSGREAYSIAALAYLRLKKAQLARQYP